MKPIVHTYTSKEPMLQVNAFAIETTKGIIAVDTTLTMSDSFAFSEMMRSLKKPLLGIVLTHGHPDHVAGAVNLAREGDVPIFALQSVYNLMMDTEETKHQQWSAVFGAEWVPKWIYPNHIVTDGETITLDDAMLQVVDLGSGGDCDANSIWLLEETPHVFVGDFIYHQNHTYMADGNILRWLANLERFEPLLANFENLYPGHGPGCGPEAIAKQKAYLLEYCSRLLRQTGGTGIFNVNTKHLFEQDMFLAHPGYGCQFMVALSAETVGKELAGYLNQTMKKG